MASIRERHSNGSNTTVWAVLFRRGKRQTSQTFATIEAAERFKTLVELLGADKALAELNGGQTAALTVDELADQFFAWKAADVEERTLADYRRDYDNWIKPRFGRRHADGIDELDVQAWVDWMKGQLDAKSIGDRHMILHSMFKFGSARSRRLVDHNPCMETQMPKRGKKPPKGMPLPVWFVFRAKAREVDPDATDLAEFIFGTGWRWSEAAALTVGRVESYVDAKGKQRVAAQMDKVMRAGQVTDDAAKSYAGFRRSKVPEPAASVVLRRCTGKGPDDLVFTNREGRKWYQQNFLNRTWPSLLRAAGLDDTPKKRFTPHHLRHSQPAVLNRAGATMPEMTRRMGHESINTTISQYGGQIDDVSDETLDSMSDILTQAVASPDVVKGEIVTSDGVVVDTSPATLRPADE